MVSWHRFFIDFGGFGEPSWEAKSSQNRSKMASKKRWKKEGQQDGQKVAIRNPNPSGPAGSRPPGRYSPNSGANPPPPPGANPVFSTSLSLCLSLSLSLLSFSLSPLSWPVFACLVLSWLGFPSQLGLQNLSKFEKNRCQKAVYLGLQILIAFWSTLAANLDPRIPHDYHFYRRETNFFWKSALRNWWRFWVRFWLQLGSILVPKIDQNLPKIRSQEASKIWSIFASIFFRISFRF